MPQNLAANLRALRLAERLTQTQLARRAGGDIRQQDVSAYERGLMPRTPEHVSRLARALNVAEDALLVDPPTVRETLELLAARAASEGRS